MLSYCVSNQKESFTFLGIPSNDEALLKHTFKIVKQFSRSVKKIAKLKWAKFVVNFSGQWDLGWTSWRACENRFPQFPVLLFAKPLEIQQDFTSSLQSHSFGWRPRWHPGHPTCRQWWKLLCRIKKLYCCHEKPSGQIQWPTVCWPIRPR